MRSFALGNAHRSAPIALLAIGLVALLVVPLSGVVGAGRAPVAGGGGPSPLAAAIDSLAHGAGPAGGAAVSCTALSGTQATCGGNTPTPAGAGSPGTGNGSWIPLAHSMCCGGMAYDPVIGRVVLFGGMNSTQTPLGGTWTYRTGNWSQVLTSPSPSARVAPALVYDPKDNYVLLFGGSNNTTYLNDTWSYQSGSWQQISTSNAPSPRAGASLAYDSRDGYVVLYGGYRGAITFSDTWRYSGGVWTNITTSGPGPRSFAAMTFDPVDHYVVLFGGYNGATYLADTWTFSNGAWTHLSPLTSPSARDKASMTWDSGLGVAVLFGGQNGAPLGDTWTYVGGTWTAVATAGPSARSGAMMAYDAATPDSYLILVGGLGTGYQHDTWNYTATGWKEVSNGNWPSAREGASVVWDPLADYAILFGGTNGLTYLNDTWKYYGGSWTQLSTPIAPSPRADASMVFLGANASATGGYVLLFGGVSASGDLNDSWQFSNGAWTPLSIAQSPSPRAGASLVFNNYYGTAVLFGGVRSASYLNDTWWFNQAGLRWVNATSASGAPSPRAYAAATFDPMNDTVLLFGGEGASGYLGDTWELRGGNSTVPARWTQDVRSAHPGARSAATLAWDTVSRYAVLFGGRNATSATLGDMWVFAQGNWSQVSVSPAPFARYDAAAFFDPAEYTLVLFGGTGATGELNDTWEWVVFIVRAFAGPYVQVDAGVSETFFPTVFGGLPPYTYAWNFGDGNVSTARAPTHAYSLPSTGPGYEVTLAVSDSANNRSTVAFNLTVNTKLTTSASATPTSTDPGVPVRFSGSFAGGTAPYTHLWLFGDGASSGSLSPTHTYTVAGTYVASLWVNDSGGMNVPHNVTISVSSSLAATVVATPRTTDAGSPVAFSVQQNGGQAPYTYSWLLGDGAVSAAATFSHTYLASGSYLVQLWVNDSLGASAYASATEVVNPALSATLASSALTVDTGTSVEFWGNASGGTTPYQFSWHFGDGGTGTGPNPSHAYTAVGTYEVRLWANDSVGQSVFRAVNITVVPGMSAVASASPLTTDVGAPVNFSVVVSGGTPPYAITWRFGDGFGASGSPALHAYTSAGVYTAAVFVNDSQGGSVRQNLTVTVNAALTGTASASPATTDAGVAVQFSGSSSGGTAPVSFAWRFGDGTGSASTSPSHTYSTPGTYTVSLWVNDSLAMSVMKTLSVTVRPAPAIAAFTASSAAVTVGGEVWLNVSATGGTGGLLLAYSGLPTGCTSSNTTSLLCTPSSTGTFNIRVTATDALHLAASANVTVTVNPAPSTPSGFLGLSGDTGYFVVAAVVIALGAIAAALLVRRRRRKSPPAEPETTTP